MIVYAYANCSTCRQALQWLRSRGIDPDVRPIVEAPPHRNDLARMHDTSGLDLKRFFNTSGGSYRALGLKDRYDRLSDDERLDLLASDGKLIRRPLALLDDGRVLVGFREAEWADALDAVG